MKRRFARTLFPCLLLALTGCATGPWSSSVTGEGTHVKPVGAYAIANIKPWLSDPVVVNAIKARNGETAKLKVGIDMDKLK